MSIAEKLTTVSENVSKVYEAGKKAEYDAFWDAVTQSGARTSYLYAFCHWDMEYLRPNQKIELDSGRMTFSYNPSLKKLESAYFDYSQMPYGTSAQSGLYYTFYKCDALEEIEDIGMQPNYGYYHTFSACDNLHTIAVIRCDENTRFSNAFDNAISVINLTVEGTIGQDGFNVRWSTKLSHDSIVSIINALSSTASGKTVTLSKTAVNKAFETSEGANDGSSSAEWTALVATKTNWTISLV